jgi:hypothetical protein
MHSHNTGRRQNNLHLGKEILKEEGEKDRIESRTTKSLSRYEKAAVLNSVGQSKSNI